MGVKELVGKVVSNKMTKSVNVAVTRMYVHPRTQVPLKSVRKFMAHDEQDTCNEGDIVRIVETRPLSRMKRWRVTDILERAKVFNEAAAVAAAGAAAAAASGGAGAGRGAAAAALGGGGLRAPGRGALPGDVSRA